jgi:hypothetical protein
MNGRISEMTRLWIAMFLLDCGGFLRVCAALPKGAKTGLYMGKKRLKFP